MLHRPLQTLRTRPKLKKMVRIKVWNSWIGTDKRYGVCQICLDEPISITCFHVGHIQSWNRGGLSRLDNLLPVCQSCNDSMGTANVIDSMNQWGFSTDHILQHQQERQQQQQQRQRAVCYTALDFPLH